MYELDWQKKSARLPFCTPAPVRSKTPRISGDGYCSPSTKLECIIAARSPRSCILQIQVCIIVNARYLVQQKTLR